MSEGHRNVGNIAKSDLFNEVVVIPSGYGKASQSAVVKTDTICQVQAPIEIALTSN